MTCDDLIGLLAGDFGAHFADRTAEAVLRADAVEVLYALAVEPCRELPAAVQHRLAFRSAWVLERIVFADRRHFEPFADRFCRVDFHACSDPGARRHFGKIMADLLSRFSPALEVWDAIAETAAGWAVDPAAKAAVRIWAVEILKSCRTHVPWVAEAWDDLVEAQVLAVSPAIRARLRNSWKSES